MNDSPEMGGRAFDPKTDLDELARELAAHTTPDDWPHRYPYAWWLAVVLEREKYGTPQHPLPGSEEYWNNFFEVKK